MNPLYLLFPCLSLLFLSLCLVLGSSYGDIPWIVPLGWTGAGLLLVAWAGMERKALLRFWRRQKSGYLMGQGGVIMMFFLVLLAIVMLSLRPAFNRQYDFTGQGRDQLTALSMRVIAEIRKKRLSPVVRAYYTESVSETPLRSLLGLYQAAGLPLEIQVFDPHIHAVEAKADGVSQNGTLVFETTITTPARRSVALAGTEEQVTRALLFLLQEEKKAIYLVTGHGEASAADEGQTGLSAAALALKSAGYAVGNLATGEVTSIPARAELIIIANPSYNLSVSEIRVIRQYLNQGGALLLLTDAMRPADTLNLLLEPYGVRLRNDYLVLAPDDPRAKMLGQNTALVRNFSDSSSLTAAFARSDAWSLYLSDARSLVTGKPEVQASPELLLHTVPETIRIEGVWQEDDLRDLHPERLHKGPSAVLAVSSWKAGERRGKLIAAGSASLALNHSLGKGGHHDFFMSMVRYLTEETGLIATGSALESPEDKLHIASASSVYLLFGICFFYPLLWLAGGVIVRNCRKKI